MDINVEEIMAEIREEIRQKGYKAQDLSFVDQAQLAKEGTADMKDGTEIENLLDVMDRIYNIPFYRHLTGGRLKVFVKRAIRKSVSFLLIPMSDSQNEFNRETLEAFRYLLAIVKKQSEQMDELGKSFNELRDRVEILERMER